MMTWKKKCGYPWLCPHAKNLIPEIAPQNNAVFITWLVKLYLVLGTSMCLLFVTFSTLGGLQLKGINIPLPFPKQRPSILLFTRVKYMFFHKLLIKVLSYLYDTSNVWKNLMSKWKIKKYAVIWYSNLLNFIFFFLIFHGFWLLCSHSETADKVSNPFIGSAPFAYR